MIRLPQGCPDIEDLLDRLYESGCDDAIVGCGNPGSLGLSFIREETAREAVIARTVRDALAGLPEGAVVEGVTLSLSGVEGIVAAEFLSQEPCSRICPDHYHPSVEIHCWQKALS